MSADYSVKQQKTIYIATDITDTEDAPAEWVYTLIDFSLLESYAWIPAPTAELTQCFSGGIDKHYSMPSSPLDFFRLFF